MKILVLGIGNVMYSDEGIGVHLCQLLKEKYNFKSDTHTIDFIDGGTLAQRLIPIIVEYEYVIILDCVDANDGNVGDVYFFDFENVPNSISWQGSAHEVEMLQTLTMIDIQGDRPTTKIIGIVPKVVEGTTLDLTKEVIKGSYIMEKTLIDHLKSFGFDCVKKSNITIQEVANKSCQGSYK